MSLGHPNLFQTAARLETRRQLTAILSFASLRNYRVAPARARLSHGDMAPPFENSPCINHSPSRTILLGPALAVLPAGKTSLRASSPSRKTRKYLASRSNIKDAQTDVFYIAGRLELEPCDAKQGLAE